MDVRLLAYSLAYSIVLLTLLLMVVKSLKPALILFFKAVLFSCICTDNLYRYHFPIFVMISYIGTIFLYSYWSHVSVLLSFIVIYDSDIYCVYYLTCYYLAPDSCMLSPITCFISLITCLIYYCLPCDYHISGILFWYPILYTVTYIFSTYVLLTLSCSCYSCNMIIT